MCVVCVRTNLAVQPVILAARLMPVYGCQFDSRVRSVLSHDIVREIGITRDPLLRVSIHHAH